MSHFKRRDFLRLGLSSGLTYLSLSSQASTLSARRLMGPINDTMASPLRPITGPFTMPDFNGDDMTRNHKALWDLPAYIASKGGRPAVSETRDVVIVGGGIAGLSSAYFLQSAKPLILEQDAQFGGNSRGEIVADTAFGIGAAYITRPVPNTQVYRMLQATGLLQAARAEEDSQSRVHMKGRGFLSMWKGEIDPAHAEIIARFSADMQQIAAQNYPNIPFEPGGMSRPEIDQLDNLTLAEWLNQRYGNALPVYLNEYLQLFCWASLGGSADEVSAAQALNFLAAESSMGVVAFPGGNAAIAAGLYGLLLRKLGRDSLRSGVMVLEVKTTPQGTVEILMENPTGELKTIACRACVMAAPKYVAQFLVPEMTQAQRKVATMLNYRAYVVANVLLNGKVASPAFDTYAMEGKVPPSPTFGKPGDRAFTDVCFAQWAAGDRGRQTVLTIYKPYPYEGARAHLQGPQAYNRVMREISTRTEDILKSLGMGTQQIGGIRLTRFGHAIPLAQPGFMTSHSDMVFKQPTNGRIFYANQDNDASPSFECAFTNAEWAAAGVINMFRGVRPR